MKVKTKFFLTVFSILAVGFTFFMIWVYYSSSKSAYHQALEGNAALSDAICEGAYALMRTGQQEQLDSFLMNAHKTQAASEVRVVRSPKLEEELGVKMAAVARDDIDRQVLSSGQRSVEDVTVGGARATHIVSPILADASCGACHPKFKEGEVMAALSSTLVYQAALDGIRLTLIENGLAQGVLIIMVIGIILFFFNRSIMEPLNSLREAVGHFGKGDLTAAEKLMALRRRGHPGSGLGVPLDEVGELAAAFSEMTQDLQKVTVKRDDLVKEMDVRKTIERDLLESNKRFDKLAEQSRTFDWEVDPQGLYTYIGRSAEMILGYRPGEIVGRMYLYDLHPEEGRETFKKATLEIMRQKETVTDLANPLRAKDGRVLWVSTNAIPFLDEKGSLLGYRGNDTDITERVKKEEEERKRSREYEVFYKASIGREERILELKKEIELLKKQLGK